MTKLRELIKDKIKSNNKRIESLGDIDDHRSLCYRLKLKNETYHKMLKGIRK